MKKNLIILMIDGGRLDRAKKSKFFNRIKATSTFFSQSITYAPHTIASMHAVFSGCYGNRTGTNSYWSTYNFKSNKFKTITEYLHEDGYYTCADTVSKLTVPEQGLDELNIHDETTDDLTIRHKIFLKKMKEINDRGQNFFLYLQFSNIHTGIMEQVLKVYNNYSKEFFDRKKENEDRYDKLFSKAEKYLENIFNQIKQLDLDNNSIILIMSDHGVSTGEKFGERAYGAFCYDYTLRTFAYFMGENFPPKEISQQVRTVDFMPTILDLLNIDLDLKYSKLDGISLIPIINDVNVEEKIAFSETGNPLNEKSPPKIPNIKSVRISNWKLIWNKFNDTRELYNLIEDPEERHNLVGKNLELENFLWLELKKIDDVIV